ncbi:hypothetical protein BDV06DRAFT_226302 [Aspergillus oleicola]
MSELPTLEEIQRAVESGQRITPLDVSKIWQLETDLTGGPGEASAAARAFSAHQMSFDSKLDQLSEKPHGHISHQDAQEVEGLEGRAFNKSPGRGSVAAQIRSIADRNQALGLPPVSADAPAAFVTKEDASDAQHVESRIYGGQNPRGGMAAQMQSAADKLEDARRGS